MKNSAIEAIVRIEDVFGAWRELGSKKLSNGTQLIAVTSDGDYDCWMHAVYPRLSAEQVDMLESELSADLPSDLRTFYRTCGGLNLFRGMFRLLGLPAHRSVLDDSQLQLDDIAGINRRYEGAAWKTADSVVFAINTWDSSVYVTGIGNTPTEVCRVDTETGEVVRRHRDVWELVSDKLFQLDEIYAQ